MTPPRYLYKYEAFTTQSLLNLKSQIIYFGSPLNFNDPYDCALTPNLVAPDDAEVESIRQAYLAKPDLPPRSRQEFESFDVQKLREALLRAAKAGFRQTVDEFLARRGVACFSERNDDLLMWSHYGGHYKGFCLQFDTTVEGLNKFHPVKYVAALPPLSVSSVLLDRDFHPVLELFCTKSAAWSYEQEWRAIHNQAGTKYGYPAHALRGIYFGPDIDAQAREIACLVLSGQNEHVGFWGGTRSTTEFRVLFEPFTYTSHLEAKRRGLIE
jgi:hypothetical protein